MALKLKWSEYALSQVQEILEYWDLRIGNTKFSSKLLLQINHRLNLVCTHPKIGKPTERNGISATFVRDYVVYYSVNDAVNVLAVFDTRRNPKSIKTILSQL